MFGIFYAGLPGHVTWHHLGRKFGIVKDAILELIIYNLGFPEFFKKLVELPTINPG